MNVTILMFMLLLPGVVLNETECHHVEFNKHFEATCVGDERYEAISQAIARGELVSAPANQGSTKGSTDQLTSVYYAISGTGYYRVNAGTQF